MNALIARLIEYSPPMAAMLILLLLTLRAQNKHLERLTSMLEECYNHLAEHLKPPDNEL